ncbi:hypothetical protein EPD60_05160 [Flaviaesturariibacter flavus]|uniref:Uncharacterized protein n=1 Tax=Flaviaesturariibacter flavus TaxID=2502780 RepID=A0A4R1BJV5_9BACT|nr:DUF6261 family protein [Flaviaesturariibacter flavus]TCJ17584.1 hypothetical protein EPD60_05160 [Flaviaesturariibacter flavus]
MFRKSYIAVWPNATVLGFFEGAAILVQQGTGTVNPVPPPFAAAQAAYEARVDELGALFKSNGASPLTGQLRSVDGRRDGLYTGMSLLVRAYAYHPDAEVAGAATLIEGSMKLYGPNLTQQPYMSQTVAVANLLKDWRDKRELAGALSALPGIEAYRAPLEAANNEFHDLYLKRVSEQASAPDFKTADKQDEVVIAYEALLRKIGGLIELSADPAPWAALQRRLDALWEQYANAEAIRQGRAKAGEVQAAAS